MRGAGCTWNDLMDQDLDAGVARTAARPLPSGQVTRNNAYMWLAAQLAVGFLIWLFLPLDAKIAALLALPLVAAYPFMKRVTWWPQAWLGATFNWGVFVAAATVGHISLPTVILWLALAAWTIAYDTIYALQDVEDDALVGVKSTARLFDDKAVIGAFSFHLIAAAIAGLATWSVGAGRLGALTMMAFMAHGVWQSLQLRREKSTNALQVFKSNVWAGAILLGGLTLAAVIGGDRTTTKMSTWETIIEPGLIEREKLRARQSIPGWIVEPEPEPAPPARRWPSLGDLFGSDADETAPAREPDETTEALPDLPDWLIKGDE